MKKYKQRLPKIAYIFARVVKIAKKKENDFFHKYFMHKVK